MTDEEPDHRDVVRRRQQEAAAAGKRGANIGCFALLGVFGLIAMCSALTSDDDEPTPSRNQSALACDHFRNILDDVGVLSAAELREKLKEVHGNASIAAPAVSSAARDLLAAATTGTSSEIQQAALDMSAACRATGN